MLTVWLSTSRHWLLAPTVVCVLLAVIGASCAPDPQRVQASALLDRLVTAKGLLSEHPPRISEGCAALGDVETKLFEEPGLTQVQSAWTSLRDATRALESTCGQNTLLAQAPSMNVPESEALRSARQRWRRGIEREMAVACDHLRQAAQALNRAVQC